MGFQVTHDLCVAVGKYKDKEGKERNRYENVGMIMTDDNGGKMMLLKRTFNPAGVPTDDPSRDSIILTVFEKNSDGQQSGQQQRSNQQSNQQSGQRRNNPPPAFDDADVPF